MGSVMQFLEVRNYDDGSKVYHCGLCGYQSVDRSNMRRHLILRHTKNMDVLCPHEHCRKSFKNRYHLRMHLNSKACLRDVLFDP